VEEIMKFFLLSFLILFVLAGCTPEGQKYTDTEICDNGIDDDGNGMTDCDDHVCCTFAVCISNPSCQSDEICYNNKDDDGDNLID